jgi:nitrogen fixation protein FixH
MTDSRPKKKRELTGKHVLLMLVAFFGVIIVTNVIFINAAVTSFRGEDVKGSYRQGLEYNETLETRKSEGQLGWSASYNVIKSEADQSRLIIAIKDAQSAPISGLKIMGKLRHPTDTKLDREIEFVESKAGQYNNTSFVPEGRWQLRATASNDLNDFSFQHSLWVK